MSIHEEIFGWRKAAKVPSTWGLRYGDERDSHEGFHSSDSNLTTSSGKLFNACS